MSSMAKPSPGWFADAATNYGSPSADQETMPTGFDPEASRLFEATVEATVLVAVAAGFSVSSDKNQFHRVLMEAVGPTVGPRQVAALLDDIGDQLDEDGLERRVQMVDRSLRHELQKEGASSFIMELVRRLPDTNPESPEARALLARFFCE